jgi:hypothetical protein
LKRYRALHPTLGSLAAGLGAALLSLLAGCGPVHLVASTNIPPPLVAKIPVGVALFIPKEFAEYVHKEERWSTDWHVELGKAQTESIQRLLAAMFERVVVVDSINAATQLGSEIRAILEPSVEEYAFVTPRDAGSPFFAVSIKYRVNVYSADGKLADSWGFTGYGTSPAQGLSNQGPLAMATSLAMRDAGAKLAVEFRDQAIVRGLLPAQHAADTSQKSGAPAQTPPPAAGGAPPAVATAPAEPAKEPSGEDPDPARKDPGGNAGKDAAAEDSKGGDSRENPASEASEDEQPASEKPSEKPGDEQPSDEKSDKKPEPEPEALARHRGLRLSVHFERRAARRTWRLAA